MLLPVKDRGDGRRGRGQAATLVDAMRRRGFDAERVPVGPPGAGGGSAEFAVHAFTRRARGGWWRAATSSVEGVGRAAGAAVALGLVVLAAVARARRRALR